MDAERPDEVSRFAPDGARSEDAPSALMKCPAHAGREKKLKKNRLWHRNDRRFLRLHTARELSRARRVTEGARAIHRSAVLIGRAAEANVCVCLLRLE